MRLRIYIAACFFSILFLFFQFSYANERFAFDSNIIYSVDESANVSASNDFGRNFRLLAKIPHSRESISNPSITAKNNYLKVFWTADNILYSAFSQDYGASWSAPKAFMIFPSAPVNIKFINDNTNIDLTHIFWIDGNGYLNYVQQNNDMPPSLFKTFNPDNPIDGDISISAGKYYLCAAWIDRGSKQILFMESFNGGQSWNKSFIPCPDSIKSIKTNYFDDTLFASWISSNSNLFKLAYSKKTVFSPYWENVNYAASDNEEINNCDLSFSNSGSIFLMWQKKSIYYYSNSLDFGKSFNTQKQFVSSSVNSGPLKLLPRKSGLTLYSESGDFYNIDNLPPQLATFNTVNNYVTNNSQPVIAVNPPNNYQSDKLILLLEFGIDPNFSKDKTATIYSQTGQYKIPYDLKDGKYYYRMRAWDGLDFYYSQSQYLIIDTVKPEISNINYLGSLQNSFVPSGEAIFKITFNEPLDKTVTPTISAVSLSDNSTFSASSYRWVNQNNLYAHFMIGNNTADGKYNLAVSNIKDSAGNELIPSSGYSFNIKKSVPLKEKNDLIIIKPEKNTWVRSGAIMAVEASIIPRDIGIEDGTSAQAIINGVIADSSLFYDGETNKLLGFIKIPDNIASGLNMLTLSVLDSRGSTREGSLELGIDSQPPAISLPLSIGSYYSNIPNKFILPVIDKYSKPDISRSTLLISFNGSTVEGTVIKDTIKNSLIFSPFSTLLDGTYQVKSDIFDLAGNSAKNIQFNLIIDTKSPKIGLAEKIPAKTKSERIDISGYIDKNSILSAYMAVNSKKQAKLNLKNGYFKNTAELSKGTNIIKIFATDIAGNLASLDVPIFFEAPPDNIYFKFNGANISNGDFVSQAPTVKITDDLNAPLAGATITLDGIEISYSELTASADIPALSPGNHTLAAVISGKNYSVSFAVENNLKISNLLCCPSPFNPKIQKTTISFNISKDSNASAYIFNQKGELVYKGDTLSHTGYNSDLEWDGKSSDGALLPNGVYLLTIIASDSSGGRANSKNKIVLFGN